MTTVRALLLLAVLLWHGAAAIAQPSAVQALRLQLDGWVRQGYERPDDALAALAALQPPHDGPVTAQRAWWLAQGLVQARSGRHAAAEESAKALSRLGDQHRDDLAQADAEQVRAVLQETQGRLDRAAEHARTAWRHYERLCAPVNRTKAEADACDHRSRWRMLQLMGARANARGLANEHQQHARAALEIAREAKDSYREAWSLAVLAHAHAGAGEQDVAARMIQQALRAARQEGQPETLARVKSYEWAVADRRGDSAAAVRIRDEALRITQESGQRRLQAALLANLSDEHVRHGRPREALQAVEQALPVARQHGDRRLERVLLHNASLARLGVGELAQARKDFDQLVALWQAAGEGELADALREFGDALAAAGDHAGALELYHRERKLTAEVRARSRESALQELQARYDREAQQRHIELLERDNALKSAQLANRTLLQRVWTLLAFTLAAAAAVAVLLYLRVRETQRQLEQSHARLRVQSERDTLTGLANRRHFQEVMRRDAQPQFTGALLLVDIDHFKHVNDRHGHAAGDEVLVEVGRRLQEAVRSEDLVVRWGGEEFLVFAPRLDGEAVNGLAERLLHCVADTPVATNNLELRVTVSIGHAAFPLPPAALPLGWERALNLVDMALYTAKSLGRHRAVGITSVQADDASGLRQVEEDFESAWTDGVVSLNVIEGR